jgi:glycosyltransferase involved in cell wall biosynthesis
LPVREEVLRAVLRADLIGFHTYDYARHFISSCTRILGLEGTPEGVEDNGALTRIAAFPIGIDPERFTAALDAPAVQGHVAKLLHRYAGRKVMLGVDRLDVIKGIPQKLLAFEKFLQEHPEWRDRVLLVQIAVPSRTDVPEYQRLRSMVHEIVGRINGAFGTLTYVPIHHLDRQLSFHELAALYAVTDVALVTSLRDGMNLVSYEYVACQSDNAGVLVLSEFAGAAQSLGAGESFGFCFVFLRARGAFSVAAAAGVLPSFIPQSPRNTTTPNTHQKIKQQAPSSSTPGTFRTWPPPSPTRSACRPRSGASATASTTCTWRRTRPKRGRTRSSPS